MSSHVSWAGAIDRLYEAVVDDPTSHTDERLAEWLAEFAMVERPPASVAKELRRAMRAARKLRDRLPDDAGPTWRAAVDGAVGPAAWRPALAIVQEGLDTAPSEELFEEVKRRIREATFDRWMDGVSFDEWVAGTP